MPSGHEELENQTKYTKHSFHIQAMQDLIPERRKIAGSPVSADQRGIPTKNPAALVWRLEESAEFGETAVLDTQNSHSRIYTTEYGRGGSSEEIGTGRPGIPGCTLSCIFMKWDSTRLEKELQESRRPNNFWNSHIAKSSACSHQLPWKDLNIQGATVEHAEG